MLNFGEIVESVWQEVEWHGRVKGQAKDVVVMATGSGRRINASVAREVVWSTCSTLRPHTSDSTSHLDLTPRPHTLRLTPHIPHLTLNYSVLHAHTMRPHNSTLLTPIYVSLRCCFGIYEVVVCGSTTAFGAFWASWSLGLPGLSHGLPMGHSRLF